MSTTTCEICGKPDCPTVEVNGQKIVGCDRCCPDPSSQPKVSHRAIACLIKPELIWTGKEGETTEYPFDTFLAVDKETGGIVVVTDIDRDRGVVRYETK